MFAFGSNAEALFVGQSTICDATSAVYGLTADLSWSTSGGYITLDGTGFRQTATITKYFTGTATITCSWKCKLYSSGTYTSMKKTWTVSCIDNKLSITPTSKSIKVGESFKINTSHNNSAFHSNANYTINCSNPGVVTVNQDGTIIGKSNGRSDVYVYSSLSSSYCTCAVTVSGDNTNGTGDSGFGNDGITLVITEPGTLSDHISLYEKDNLTALTISGVLDGSDLRLLRYMSGLDHNRKATNGKLKYLDLRNCIFVEGGPWYLDNPLYTDNSNKLPREAFHWCDKLETFLIPEYSNYLSSYFWYYSLNKGPYSITIPASIETIAGGNFGFMYKLSSITLPSSLKTLNSNFDGDNALTEIICLAKDPPTAGYFPSKLCEKAVLYVPKGSSSKYWRAPNWLKFSEIRELSYKCNAMILQVCTKGGTVSCDGRERRAYLPEVGYDGFMAFDKRDTETSIINIKPDTGYIIRSVTVDNIEQKENLINSALSIRNDTPHNIKIYFEESKNNIVEVQNDKSRVEYYNLNGMKIDNPSTGVFIKKESGTYQKIMQRKR